MSLIIYMWVFVEKEQVIEIKSLALSLLFSLNLKPWASLVTIRVWDKNKKYEFLAQASAAGSLFLQDKGADRELLIVCQHSVSLNIKHTHTLTYKYSWNISNNQSMNIVGCMQLTKTLHHNNQHQHKGIIV